MARPLLSEALWKVIEPVLPPPPKRRFRHPGRKRLGDRECLTGILFVLKTGIPWEHLPKELGWGSGMTCWRRLRDWQAAGVWEKLHGLLLDRLNGADKIDWERASVDSSSLRSVGAGEKKRAKSHGQGASGKQAAPRRRRRRNPFGPLFDTRQRRRRHATAAARRRHP